MNLGLLSRAALVFACSAFTAIAVAAPVTYIIDSGHTYPAFEADHQGGLSIWRGKIERTEGTVMFDKEAQSGTVEVTMDMASIDFGHAGMNEHAMAADILDVARFPTATYVGQLADFVDGSPTAVEGELTLHGVTLPVDLTINRFRCQPHFRHGREVCGADAETVIDRGAFGVTYDLDHGFFPEVKLLITIEAQIPPEG